MNQPPLNPDASDQYEYRIDALIQRRAKGTDEDFQTFGLALTEDGREYLGKSVDDLNSMVSTGLFEVVDGPIPGHCPNCSEKIAAALPEVTSVPGVYDLGSPEPAGVDHVVECDEFGEPDERGDSANDPTWSKTTDGTRWKGYKDGKEYRSWADLVRRYGPLVEYRPEVKP